MQLSLKSRTILDIVLRRRCLDVLARQDGTDPSADTLSMPKKLSGSRDPKAN